MRHNLIQAKRTAIKKTNSRIRRVLIVLFTYLLFAFIPFQGFGQGDPPPPPGGHDSNGDQTPGGSAPIGEGFVFLTVMAIGYGAKKLIFNAKEKEE